VKILILWSGAVVPSYRRFFLELAKRMQVRVLAPRRWTHGSIAFGEAEPIPGPAAASGGAAAGRCEFFRVAYLPEGGSRYWVPSLVLHLWAYRPRYLYVMEELDRPSLAWNALMARLAWPPVRIVSYSLQNLPEPSYYRWHHRLALRANRILVSRTIAASGEADRVLRDKGFRKPTRVIPLWGSEADFYPGEPGAVASFRRGLGLKEGEIAILFAGSMVEAKGLLLLRQVLPRFRHIRIIAAGKGPLQEDMARSLGRQWVYLGALEGDDLRRFYQAGDYVILPSLTLAHWKEQIGRALIEGILCGCIALGSDSGHIPELTLFPETTFRQGEAESLARMLSGLPLRDADSVRGAQRRNVEQRFTASAVARETSSFLESRT
jgi:glycosyltransferase involved in cell wall biosynthesis